MPVVIRLSVSEQPATDAIVPLEPYHALIDRCAPRCSRSPLRTSSRRTLSDLSW